MWYKTNNECLSFVWWYINFQLMKDEMFYSTWLRLVLYFTSWKYLYHCTHNHSLFVYYLSHNENICTIALITIHYLHIVYNILCCFMYHVSYVFYYFQQVTLECISWIYLLIKKKRKYPNVSFKTDDWMNYTHHTIHTYSHVRNKYKF